MLYSFIINQLFDVMWSETLIDSFVIEEYKSDF